MDNSRDSEAKRTPKPQAAGNKDTGQADWTNSLRNMYDKVVDEPIPDSFKDLLAQLDEPGKDGGGTA